MFVTFSKNIVQMSVHKLFFFSMNQNYVSNFNVKHGPYIDIQSVVKSITFFNSGHQLISIVFVFDYSNYAVSTLIWHYLNNGSVCTGLKST